MTVPTWPSEPTSEQCKRLKEEFAEGMGDAPSTSETTEESAKPVSGEGSGR